LSADRQDPYPVERHNIELERFKSHDSVSRCTAGSPVQHCV
ncbi:uncharacterized protein METZ01_LOCUS484033, partial [marine metagenome]